MSESLVVPLVTLILVLSAVSAYGFIRRLRRIQKLQAQAAAAQNTAIIYTIPTNAPSAATQRPNTGSSILFPNRNTYFAPSAGSNNDLPPSYEDVTKDGCTIVNFPTTEVTPPPTTTAPTNATTASS